MIDQYRVVEYKKSFYPQYKQVKRKWFSGEKIIEWKYFTGRNIANGFDQTLYSKYFSTLADAKLFLTNYIGEQNKPEYIIHLYP